MFIKENMETFDQIIKSDRLVLVDFYADWCGPCKIMAPILSEVKQELGDGITIIKVDVDKNQAGAAAYQVWNIPTLILFKKGNVLWKQAGVVRRPQLLQILKAHQ